MPMGGSASCRRVSWPHNVTTPPMGTMAKERKAGTTERYGAMRKTLRSARSGNRFSFIKSFIPSANVCNSPKGPARLGPMRFCMSEMTLRSNQTMNMVAISITTKVTRTLRATMPMTAQPTPSTNSGSPAAPIFMAETIMVSPGGRW